MSARRLALWLLILLLVPVVPFLILGSTFEAEISDWIGGQQASPELLALIVGTLIVDIFLPIPSSGIILFCGVTFGFWTAWLACTFGLGCGCSLGYELARSIGPRILARFSEKQDQQQMREWSEKYGPMFLVITRPLPVLGETAILIVGSLQMRRKVFYPFQLVANSVVVLGYALVGTFFAGSDHLTFVLIASLLLPLALTGILRKQKA